MSRKRLGRCVIFFCKSGVAQALRHFRRVSGETGRGGESRFVVKLCKILVSSAVKMSK